MPEKEEKPEQGTQQKPKETEQKEAGTASGAAGGTGGGGSKLGLILIVSVAVAGIVGGFSAAQFIGRGKAAGTEEKAAEAAGAEGKGEKVKAADLTTAADGKSGEKKSWAYEIDPVVANLDEPGVTRYARVAVTLELSSDMDKEKGKLFLDDKKPMLRDFLTTYIAGLSIEGVRGTSNLTRIKREIRDQFNEMLFPGTRPLIENILFKEFAIQ